jgi:hypothetical protein
MIISELLILNKNSWALSFQLSTDAIILFKISIFKNTIGLTVKRKYIEIISQVHNNMLQYDCTVIKL